MTDFLLGIDLGTTSVKVCVVDRSNGRTVYNGKKDTNSTIPFEDKRHEQDVSKIIHALQDCVLNIPLSYRKKIRRIGVCGQMHGVVLWSNDTPWIFDDKSSKCILNESKFTHLYTWQDGRCDQAFIEALPQPSSHLKAHAGFGCVTLFWLATHHKSFLDGFNCAGTIQDFAVSMMCDLESPLMSEHNAASWGYFDCLTKSWNRDILQLGGFPVRFLPEIRESRKEAGRLAVDWCGIPHGTPVSVALGDIQCSIIATLQSPSDAVLNISTSSQLAVVTASVPRPALCDGKIEYFPYFDGKFLAVSASLNGGNVLDGFVGMIQQWSQALGSTINKENIWRALESLNIETASTDLNIKPVLFGERWNPATFASATNLHSNNLDLSSVYTALCRGILRNMHEMMPKEFLAKEGITRILGTGSVLQRNKIIQDELKALYRIPIEMWPDAEADKGAAIAFD